MSLDYETERRSAPAPTEDSIACRIEVFGEGQFLFNHTRGKWKSWDGQIWRDDELGGVMDAVRVTCRGEGPKYQKSSIVKGVEFLLRSSRVFATTHAAFDSDPLLVGTPGGTVDLRTGKMRKADPCDRISKSTAVSPRKGEPTVWLKFLAEATGEDQAFVRFLQQIAGYALSGDTSAQCLFFFYGDGGTGKSTYMNTLLEVFGTYAVTAPMDTFVASSFDKHSTDLAMLAGARLVAANETEQGRKWAAARIKSLSGGDPITARFMRQDFFTYMPTFKLMFFGNFAPSLEFVDEAMRRRFHVIPFNVKPKVKDERLREKLRAELPQILQWCIEGCLDWQRNGLVVPEKVQLATNAYFEGQDLFKQWLDEKVQQPGDYKMNTTKAEVMVSWNAFRIAAGEKPESAQAVTQRLTRAGFKEGRPSGGNGPRERVWFNLVLTND